MIIKKLKILIFKIIFIIVSIGMIFLITSCSISDILNYDSQMESLQTKIKIEDIDNNEIKSMKAQDTNIIENIEDSEQFEISEEKIRDPFLPEYLSNDADSSEGGSIVLEKIYSEDNLFYCEISFNDFNYKLKENDQFGKIYQVQVINQDSVVLLKGDEIITIYIGEIYYDENNGN